MSTTFRHQWMPVLALVGVLLLALGFCSSNPILMVVIGPVCAVGGAVVLVSSEGRLARAGALLVMAAGLAICAAAALIAVLLVRA